MCLYPKLIPNRRYLPNKKNGGVPPACPDERLRYVTAACGDCLECRQQKQRAWKVRMNEELRQEPNAYFLTLTITDEHYAILKNKYNLENDNDIATRFNSFIFWSADCLVRLFPYFFCINLS